MSKKALLLATDSWEKMGIFADFFEDHDLAVWRNRLRHTPEKLLAIGFPINLYFYHRNYIGYRAHCVDIRRGSRADWPTRVTPPAFRADMEPYTTGVYMDRIATVQKTHISAFPKWQAENEHFAQGNLQLLEVVDILDPP